MYMNLYHFYIVDSRKMYKERECNLDIAHSLFYSRISIKKLGIYLAESTNSLKYEKYIANEIGKSFANCLKMYPLTKKKKKETVIMYLIQYIHILMVTST